MNALTINQLSVSYTGTPNVLNNISLTVREGERVGLIGPNGVGKTTLFHTICGVIKPTSGEVKIFDQPVKVGGFNPAVGLVFQYPDDQLFSPSVREDIAFGPQNMGLSPAAVDARVNEVMAMVGITELAERPPHLLSGGQKRMVAIAGIQAMQPKLVIYDEPSANLDIRSRRRLIRFIQASNETVLVSSHDLELILELCDRVILLDHGQIIKDAAAKQVMGDSELMEAHGLEKPHSLQYHVHIPEDEVVSETAVLHSHLPAD